MTPAFGMLGNPYDVVLDVGGSVGDFAETAYTLWPKAVIVSFEPIPRIAEENAARSRGRWRTEGVAISNANGGALLNVCTNQHSASTMQTPGDARRREFGISDVFVPFEVPTRRLDEMWSSNGRNFGRLLLKIDVEGHERQVLLGAQKLLSHVATVVVEVQNDPTIFLGSPSPNWIDAMLRAHGLFFHGLLDSFVAPNGRLLQFDGIWKRYEEEP